MSPPSRVVRRDRGRDRGRRDRGRDRGRRLVVVWPSTSVTVDRRCPSWSTISTWCSSQSSAFDLRIWAISSGTASFCSYALRTSLAFWPYCIADARVLGLEVVVVDLERLGGGDGPQREVDLDRLLGLHLQRLDERCWRPGRWPPATGRGSMPCAWNCCTVFCTRGLQVGLRPSPRAARSSTSSASAVGGPIDELVGGPG